MSGEIWTIRTENDDRVRRARSWLKKSKRAHSDVERFLYLWISFNAAYGQTADNGRFGAEGPRGPCETEIQEKFLHKICERDRPTRRLQAIVTGRVRQSDSRSDEERVHIRTLLGLRPGQEPV